VRRFVIVVMIGGLVLAACGSDSSSSSLTSYQQSLLPGLEASLLAKNDSGVDLSASQRTCIANSVLAAVGDADLKAAGLTAKNVGSKFEKTPSLGDAAAKRAALAFSKCVDLSAILEKGVAADPNAGLTAAQAKCVFQKISNQDLIDYFASTMGKSGDSSPAAKKFTKDVTDAVATCKP
jgi:hypothetical protein